MKRTPIPRKPPRKRSTARAELAAGIEAIGAPPTTIRGESLPLGSVCVNGIWHVPEAPPPRRVTTSRKASQPQPKRGEMLSPSLRGAIKRGEILCQLPHCWRVAIEPSHYPSRGAYGGTNDLLCAASCRDCHDAWHGGHLLAAEMERAVYRTWFTLAQLHPGILRSALRELANEAP